ncbi:MAG: hypothetical protein MJZ20_12790 [Bacteroidaceae bacterium]|nr:hypothetical protein [Bacteroidaceae bacterium]
MNQGLCQACGNIFYYRADSKPDRKKFCKTCVQIKTSTYNRIINSVDPEIVATRKRMHDLSDVVAKAKKVGMSYGQYMAAKGEFLRKLSES